MTTAADALGLAGRMSSPISTLIRRLLRVPTVEYPLNARPLPIKDMPEPAELTFLLGRHNGLPVSPAVEPGDEVGMGQPLGKSGEDKLRPSSVSGKVLAVPMGPDLRGGGGGPTVVVAPEPRLTGSPFSPLDAKQEAVGPLAQRIRDAGILTNATTPKPLLDALGADDVSKTLVVLAADREPGVSSAAALLLQRQSDVGPAASLLGRIAGAQRVILAVSQPLVATARDACQSPDLAVMPLPAVYPQSLDAVVAHRAGAGAGAGSTRVIALETALAALDAVKEGAIQSKKVVTIVGPDGKGSQNLRVSLGTKLCDVLAAAKIEPKERDKVLAGGPMGGFAQFSLEASVDVGVDAVMLIPEDAVRPWSDAPCVSCGACIDVCPAQLQVQLIGRYAEFGLFDRTEEEKIDLCIECGLCASVCTAQRPLLQLLRLAKQELHKSKQQQYDPPSS